VEIEPSSDESEQKVFAPYPDEDSDEPCEELNQIDQVEELLFYFEHYHRQRRQKNQL